MIYEIFIGIISILGLLIGAELVIHNARIIARKLNISDFFIGLTIFSIGTSLPEIATHVIASIDILRGVDFHTMSGLAVGTNVGSNIIQISLITGIVAFFGVLKAKKKFLKVDYNVMLASIVILFLFSLNGIISRVEGFILLFLYAAYLVYLFKNEKIAKKILKKNENIDKSKIYLSLLVMLAGLVILLLSADKIAGLAELFSVKYLVSGSLLGVLIVGISTALPEFATAVFALRRKNAGMSLGTLVGSNITNPLMALGIGAIISTYAVDSTILWYDIPFWFIISVIPIALMWRKKMLTKKAGIFLMLAYVAFVAFRIWLF